MADEKDQRRGAPDKEESKPGPGHEHKFTSVIDNPADPPKREVCEVCGETRPAK